MESIKDIISELKKVRDTMQKILSDRETFVIMGMDEIVLSEKMSNLKDKERNLKIEYVKKVHVTKEGKEREITLNGNLYRTYLPDRTPVRAKTLEGVYLKLYDYYAEECNLITDYTVRNVYILALNHKKKNKGVNNNLADASKKNTILRDDQDYERFIDSKFATLDIRKITPQKVEDYILDTLSDIYSSTGIKLNIRSYNEHFKHILNLIFDYAEERNIIEHNYIRSSMRFKSERFSDLLDYTKKDAEDKAFSEEEIKSLTDEVRKRMTMPNKYGNIYTNGYMFILSTLTGMRIGELCSLKKEDINFEDKYIHVHTQQLKEKNSKDFEYCPHTKNEKKGSNGGRFVPLTDPAENLLKDLFLKQKQFGIKSDWVFANPDGDWVRTDQYTIFLYRLCKSFGFNITNNHAIRMYFNSYVLSPLGVEIADRAKILGHSVDVNSKNYTFADRHYCESVRQKLNQRNNNIE